MNRLRKLIQMVKCTICLYRYHKYFEMLTPRSKKLLCAICLGQFPIPKKVVLATSKGTIVYNVD